VIIVWRVRIVSVMMSIFIVTKTITRKGVCMMWYDAVWAMWRDESWTDYLLRCVEIGPRAANWEFMENGLGDYDHVADLKDAIIQAHRRAGQRLVEVSY